MKMMLRILCSAALLSALLLPLQAQAAVPVRQPAPVSLSNFHGLTCYGLTVPPVITGFYVDNYGYKQIVAPNAWVSPYSATQADYWPYCSVNNAAQVIIAQNAPTNSYYPLLYSQFDWTYYEGNLWYCQIAYNAPTRAAAAAVPPANRTDPAVGGCGPFPWSELIPQNPFAAQRRPALHI